MMTTNTDLAIRDAREMTTMIIITGYYDGNNAIE